MSGSTDLSPNSAIFTLYHKGFDSWPGLKERKRIVIKRPSFSCVLKELFCKLAKVTQKKKNLEKPCLLLKLS
jgi:hypothetical protein